MPHKELRLFMPDKKDSLLNIGLVGGRDLCIELLERVTFPLKDSKAGARIRAVADADPQAPGMILARKLGLEAVTDYHDLYNPEYDLHLIIILVPDSYTLWDILNTRPAHIRILSYHVFELFWKAIDLEEKKLRERNREVETILNGIQDFILVLNPQMEIIDVNDSFLSKMCYTREAVIGRKCHEVFQKANLQCSQDVVVCPLNEAIRNKQPSQRIMTRVNNRGQLRYIEITIYPLWEKDGKISKFIEISRDITDRKKQEEEITRRLERMVAERTRQLKETHEKLLHQDKMASLGKLSASVVHEINNPIAGVLNLILLIKRFYAEDNITHPEIERFNHYLSLMETETRRVSRIVSNLLAFSRQTKLELAPLDLNRLVDASLMLNANLMKIHTIKIEKRLDPQIPPVFGSEDQLQQVFMNVISNAVEAMEGRERPTLTVESRLTVDRATVAVTFADTGTGVPEENLPRLFEPFFTTKKKGKGVGLGLSVAYGIIQEHGGSMRVSSRLGEGTEFTVELPVEPKTASQMGGGPDEEIQDSDCR
jgi:two-component system NtrC family sensor kinase